jgi:two-component system chemotaxis sensor kinase CheA
VAWSNDPEMQKMFLDEVTERSARLVEGAQALRAGEISPQEAGDLLREGHTIKGTGRVMGYEDIGSAGLMLEMIWRWIQQGDITPTPIFGRVLEALSLAIPSALDDPAELSEAMAAVHEFFEGQELPEALPPAPPIERGTPAEPVPDAGASVIFLTPRAAVGPTPRVEVIEFAVERTPPPELNVPEEPAAGQPVSAHDAFARLAGGGLEDDGFVDEAVTEPAVSAHDVFAQLAGDAVGIDEPAVSVDEGREPPMLAAVADESTSDAGASEATDTVPSAQDAFAELRRSMMMEDAAAEIAAEPESQIDDMDPDEGKAPAVEAVEEDPADDIGESLPFSILSRAESSTEVTVPVPVDPVEPVAEAVDGSVGEIGDEAQADTLEHQGDDSSDASGDDSIGDVIEFPVSNAETDDTENADEPAGQTAQSADAPGDPGVVALPSNRRTAPGVATDADDLGGLVRAVQTWAAEESIAVNTGRLYELVNHIVSLRMDIEAVKGQLAEFAEVAAADPFFSDRVSNIAQGVEPVAATSELIEAKALALAAAPLRDVASTLPQLGRYLSRKTGKDLRVEIFGDNILVDRQVLDRLGDAMRQLVVNSAVHGIEPVDTRLGAGKPGTGTIRIEAKQSDVNLEVSVIDDGRGIDWRAIREKGLSLGLLDASAELAPDALRSLLYRSGFTTSDTSDELAGDGDGLALVRAAMESMNGSLRVESTPKQETRITMVVPIHQAMQKALLVKTAGIIWGIPETGVVDVVEMNLATIAVADHTTVLERVDGDVPFASFADLMGLHSDSVPVSIVVVTSAAGSVALGVEEVIGVRRVAAKELGAVLADAQADEVTGAALLGGEQVVLLLDPTRLAERQREVVIEPPAFPAARVLIVDDSVGVQQVVSSALATSGFGTTVAASVADALGSLHSGSIDAVVVDFSMPRADGVALAHMVRQRHGDLPIVMLSGVAEGEDIDRAREAGVDAFFNKADFHGGGLAEKLRELITIRREREQTA